MKVDEEWEKFYHREEAYAPLEGIDDPAPPDVEGPELDTLAGTGFFNTLSYDSDLMTTRRRSIAALLRKNEQGVKLLRMPGSVEDLQFSKYHQAMARTLGQIRQPDNRVLSMLAAVLSPGAIQRLFGGDDTTGEDAAAYLQEARGIRPVGSDSPLNGAPFDKLPGVAHGDLANTNTWTRARNRALTATQKQIAKERIGQDDLAALQTTSQPQIEEAQPPNVMTLQMGLELSRALSDHEPMLLGLWVDRNRAKTTASAPATGGSTTGGSTTGASGGVAAPQDVLAAVQPAELNLSNALQQQEGPAHRLSDLIHHVATGWIANASRALVSFDQGRGLTARIAVIYDVATRYLDGTLRGDAFADAPGGIVNIGNTCYLNATVQVLAAHAHYRGLIANAVVVNLDRRRCCTSRRCRRRWTWSSA